MKYFELGLVNSNEIYSKALNEKFGIPGFNFYNMEQLQAILIACLESQSPVLLQLIEGAIDYIDWSLLPKLVQGGVEMMKRMAKEKGLKEIPIVLHLDHGDSFDLCKKCIDIGFSSVMFDGSLLPFEENIRISKKVVEYAHSNDVSVECELGKIKGSEANTITDSSFYTNPDDAVRFIQETGCDSLAISIGTSHGMFKFNVESADQIPPLRCDILNNIITNLGRPFPIVLHGASSVNVIDENGDQYIDIINKYGGKIEKAFGIPESQISDIVKKSVVKVNIDSDCRLAMMAGIRKVLFNQPKEFDPRKYLGEARKEMVKIYKHKISVLGSNNRV
jgi:fructose-bisphosphate aldolase class II